MCAIPYTTWKKRRTGKVVPLFATTLPREEYRIDPETTMGLEAEFLLYEAPAMAPASRKTMGVVCDRLRQKIGEQRLSFEFPVHQLEIKTAPHANISNLVGEYCQLSAALVETAEAQGACVLPISLDPLSPSAEINWEYYANSVAVRGKHGAGVCKLQGIGSFQWNVAVSDGNAAIFLNNTLRRCAHHLLALTVNSPFYDGRPTGLLSMRANVRGLLLDSGWVQEHITEQTWEEYFERRRRMCSIGRVMSAPWSHNGPFRIRPDRQGRLCMEIAVCEVVPSVKGVKATSGFLRHLVTRLLMAYKEGEPLPEFFGPIEALGLMKCTQEAAMHGPKGTFLTQNLDAVSADTLLRELIDYAGQAPGGTDVRWSEISAYLEDTLDHGTPAKRLLSEFQTIHFTLFVLNGVMIILTMPSACCMEEIIIV